MYKQKSHLTYNKINLESQINDATPYQLISLLYKEALSAIKRAEIFMQQNNIIEKCTSISKAIDILDTGLKQALNHEAGGEIANNLEILYDYMILRLFNANIENNIDYLQEVYKLLLNISNTWKQIGINFNER
ncbi:flagellar export chaperone FliS [Providencia sneebia]|uniref:Flagellar secretion chaperone FliS n=1 Tax=Providencia sneebia DSM 19967 TaxID=1141660 RepID=K8WM84_9GAMM|nr:flagellar export chaperone FliS [Providencia sneebia]EKT58587.1 flagellar protein FliS [Providencia sneebia DSM 19967]